MRAACSGCPAHGMEKQSADTADDDAGYNGNQDPFHTGAQPVQIVDQCAFSGVCCSRIVGRIVGSTVLIGRIHNGKLLSVLFLRQQGCQNIVSRAGAFCQALEYVWRNYDTRYALGPAEKITPEEQLLVFKRLRQAAYLLKNTKVSVEDIIVVVGYDNSSYFHRIFKEQYGMTPKKYRDGTETV